MDITLSSLFFLQCKLHCTKNVTLCLYFRDSHLFRHLTVGHILCLQCIHLPPVIEETPLSQRPSSDIISPTASSHGASPRFQAERGVLPSETSAAEAAVLLSSDVSTGRPLPRHALRGPVRRAPYHEFLTWQTSRYYLEQSF